MGGTTTEPHPNPPESKDEEEEEERHRTTKKDLVGAMATFLYRHKPHMTII